MRIQTQSWADRHGAESEEPGAEALSYVIESGCLRGAVVSLLTTTDSACNDSSLLERLQEGKLLEDRMRGWWAIWDRENGAFSAVRTRYGTTGLCGPRTVVQGDTSCAGEGRARVVRMGSSRLPCLKVGPLQNVLTRFGRRHPVSAPIPGLLPRQHPLPYLLAPQAASS